MNTDFISIGKLCREHSLQLDTLEELLIRCAGIFNSTHLSAYIGKRYTRERVKEILDSIIPKNDHKEVEKIFANIAEVKHSAEICGEFDFDTYTASIHKRSIIPPIDGVETIISRQNDMRKYLTIRKQLFIEAGGQRGIDYFEEEKAQRLGNRREVGSETYRRELLLRSLIDTCLVKKSEAENFINEFYSLSASLVSEKDEALYMEAIEHLGKDCPKGKKLFAFLLAAKGLKNKQIAQKTGYKETSLSKHIVEGEELSRTITMPSTGEKLPKLSLPEHRKSCRRENKQWGYEAYDLYQ